MLEGVYGTPQTAALTKKLEEDKILGTSPGFGTAAATDGKRYPYVFPIAASYWSQGAAAVAFAKKELGGSLKGKKIAYLFYRQPRRQGAARHSRGPRQDPKASSSGPLPFPHPASKWARRCSTSPAATSPTSSSPICSAASPSVSIKELKGKGYPLSKVISLVWGASEADIKAAGGYERGRGLPHHPVRRRRQRFPGHQGHQRDVPGAGQAGAEGAGDQRLLQSRRHDRRDSRRGRAQRHQGQGRRQAHQRGRQERAWRPSRASRSAAWCLPWR